MGLLKEKECMENSQFWYLETLEWETKFGQKIKSVCCVKVVENGAKSWGIQKYILVVIFIIITNLCT